MSADDVPQPWCIDCNAPHGSALEDEQCARAHGRAVLDEDGNPFLLPDSAPIPDAIEGLETADDDREAYRRGFADGWRLARDAQRERWRDAKRSSRAAARERPQTTEATQ